MSHHTYLKEVQNGKQWDFDTSDYFTLRLDGLCAVLTALRANLEDFDEGDYVAGAEPMVLALQHVLDVTTSLEKISYELDTDPHSVGDLSLQLMWARALIEIIVRMFEADSWKITLGSRVLVDYLGSVERILTEAHSETVQIHRKKFPKAPTAAKSGRNE